MVQVSELKISVTNGDTIGVNAFQSFVCVCCMYIEHRNIDAMCDTILIMYDEADITNGLCPTTDDGLSPKMFVSDIIKTQRPANLLGTVNPGHDIADMIEGGAEVEQEDWFVGAIHTFPFQLVNPIQIRQELMYYPVFSQPRSMVIEDVEEGEPNLAGIVLPTYPTEAYSPERGVNKRIQLLFIVS